MEHKMRAQNAPSKKTGKKAENKKYANHLTDK